ncbi:hypothetical protein J0910_01600 [Nocardiopsis sp. CNT-189]|uniref:hypothetical protein n=1 Tax=Nocardiopsis oceanisediminis TaxID=2816862 RepID=UPI003B2C1A69
MYRFPLPAHIPAGIDPALFAELSAPRGLCEPLQDHLARTTALADILADLPPAETSPRFDRFTAEEAA